MNASELEIKLFMKRYCNKYVDRLTYSEFKDIILERSENMSDHTLNEKNNVILIIILIKKRKILVIKHG